jgi:hypothetical protein
MQEFAAGKLHRDLHELRSLMSIFGVPARGRILLP